MNETPVPPPPSRRLTRARLLGWRAIKLEYYGYLSIGRFILRRDGVPPGGRGFSYHASSLTPLIVFLVLSAVELIVVDILVQRWPTLRITMLVLGAWGLAYMFGLLFGMITRPHVVTTGNLRANQGPEVSLSIPWESVHSVTRKRIVNSRDKAPKVTRGPEGRDTVNLWVSNETNIVIDLEESREFRLPGRTVWAQQVRIYADDPSSFMSAVRPILAPSPPT